MTRCTAELDLHHSVERIGSYLADVAHLPDWTTFFRSVGEPVNGRYPVRTASGSVIHTRIEHPAHGRYVISSLIGEREERADLDLVATASGSTTVRFTVTVLAALEASVGGVDAQRERMGEELRQLARAVTV